ncbi:MAG: hypothetical protein KGK00_16365 [Paracoccaceae bacterium]|nr:hypothetical protein [Paracoccaceae bacterium]MDE3239875.1 hypothetical protein [Paracoccaceae bacterium]
MFTSVHTTELTLSHLGHAKRHGLVSRIMAARRARKELQRIADYDARLLDDVGLTRQDALDAAQKPIWDVPAHWRA